MSTGTALPTPPSSLRTVLAAVAIAAACAVPASQAEGAFVTRENNAVSGQRGAEMDFGSMTDPGWVRQYDSWPDAERDEIRLHDVYEGEATVETLQEVNIDMIGSRLSIWQHGRVRSASYPHPLGQAERAWNVGGSGWAHADAALRHQSFRIQPEEGESIGDPVILTFDASFEVRHRLNDQIYNEWTEIDIGDDGIIDYKMAGQLDGQYPAPYAISLTPAGETEEQPLLQAGGKYRSNARVFHHEMVRANIGDLVTFTGGVLAWQNVNTIAKGNEKVTSDLQFFIDMTVTPDSPGSIGVVYEEDFEDIGDFEETGFNLDSSSGEGTAELRENPLVPEDGQGLILEEPDGAITLSRTIDCEELVELQMAYWFVPSEPAELTILLGGEELTSMETTGEPVGELSVLDESFALADYGLTPGELLLELKLSNPVAPDPGVFLDDLRVITAPEPATLAVLGLGGLFLLRRR